MLDFLISNRIETVFVTPTGRFRARLALDEHRHVTLRKAQYLNLSMQAFALKTAAGIVQGKITNMCRFLLLRARQYQTEALKVAAVRLKFLCHPLSVAANLDVVRGLEGAATRIYFGAFGHLIQNQAFSSNGRNRRPPLDPYLGSLHEIDYGRASLACDLVEEYRCFMADRLVLGLINRKAVSPDDFIFRRQPPAEFIDEAELKARRPVEMKPAVARTFITAYEQMMARSIHYPPVDKKLNHRWLILNQLRSFAGYLEEPQKAYQPFVWEI